MANTFRNQRGSSEAQKGKNLILVSNNNPDYFGDVAVPGLFSRSSSANNDSLFGQNMRRQSSSGISNLFLGFKNDQKFQEPIPKKQDLPTQEERYAQECLQYEKYLFDDKIKLIIHRMSIKAYQNLKDKSDHQFLSFFIQRFLCIISKKLLLNRFELLFLEYVFEESKWKYEIEVITKHAHQFNPYIHISQAEGNQESIKNLQVYLLFCAYYSKKSLNQFPSECIFNGFLKSLCDKFKEYFNQWSQNSSINNIKINPKILNNIFKRLTSYSDKERDYLQNYTLLVQEIIEISPAYNADKNPAKPKKNKKRKTEQHFDVIQEHESPDDINQLQFKQEESVEVPDLPMLNNRNKKQTSYMSNVDGLDPSHYYQRNS